MQWITMFAKVDADQAFWDVADTITFGNATAYAPDIGQVTVAPLALS